MRRERLTIERIEKFKCPPNKEQAYLRDTEAPRLAVRATANKDAKAFVFEAKLNRHTIRCTIGSVKDWTTEDARVEAGRLKRLVDQGIDPRKERAERDAAAERERLETERGAVLFSQAWRAYLEAPHLKWGERHRADHLNLARLGGKKWQRGEGKTNAGPLAPLMPLPLRELNAKRLKAWLQRELAQRPTQTRLAFSALRAFVKWCAGEDAYPGIIDPAIFDDKEVRDMLPKKGSKDDCLDKLQLQPWFEAVRKLDNLTASAYLQALLLTGARREEMAELKWSNVDFKWQRLTIRDKVEGERTIPLTPYVAALLRDLQRRNVRPLRLPPGENWKPSPWVFTSPTAESGRIADPRLPHTRALHGAGIEGLSLHGLRRSFGTLAEWVECPVGVVAQIQGHKPSATAEKHYRKRPLDLLRLWHTRIEDWILNEAGIQFTPTQERAHTLAVVNQSTVVQ